MSNSPAFQTLSEDTRGLKHQLNAIRYSLVIKDGVVTVSNWRSEIDYGAAIQADFEEVQSRALRATIVSNSPISPR